MFTYTSEQEDELTIQAGDILEVLDDGDQQDGWWKVKLNGKVGLVPDNFVELLQPAEAAEPLPVKKEPRRPPPAPEAQDKPPDFGVPATEPLDSSAVKDRPHKPGGVRPPSRSNLHQEETAPAVGAAGVEAPWQKEIKQRKKKDPVRPPAKPHPPPPAVSSEPEKKPPLPKGGSKPFLGDKPKPRPPPAKPAVVDPVKPKTSPAKHPEAPTATATEATPPQSAEEWKEALEKLREEFSEFRVQIRRELKLEIQTLSDDLDEERKNNAALKIDIDRLKKMKL